MQLAEKERLQTELRESMAREAALCATVANQKSLIQDLERNLADEAAQHRECVRRATDSAQEAETQQRLAADKMASVQLKLCLVVKEFQNLQNQYADVCQSVAELEGETADKMEFIEKQMFDRLRSLYSTCAMRRNDAAKEEEKKAATYGQATQLIRDLQEELSKLKRDYEEEQSDAAQQKRASMCAAVISQWKSWVALARKDDTLSALEAELQTRDARRATVNF